MKKPKPTPPKSQDDVARYGLDLTKEVYGGLPQIGLMTAGNKMKPIKEALMDLYEGSVLGSKTMTAGTASRIASNSMTKQALKGMNDDGAANFLGMLEHHLGIQPDDDLANYTIDELFKVLFGK